MIKGQARSQFCKVSVFGQDTALHCDVSIRMRSLTRICFSLSSSSFAFLQDDVLILADSISKM